MLPNQSDIAKQALKYERPMAVRMIELSEKLEPLNDVQNHWGVRVFATWKGTPIGSFDIANRHQTVSPETLSEAIAETPELSTYQPSLDEADSSEPLPQHFSVSIVIPTFNRPQELHSCLKHLVSQQTHRSVEIIVIDNCPRTGVTPPVVAKFAGVKLVSEWRQGASYARNAGIRHSQGEIIVNIDDDVTPSPHWLEHLIRPFARPEVMVVTGNVLPLELETPAQQLFEVYGMGGLGRGFRYFEVKGAQMPQFQGAVPVWELGASANVAFRASVFRHPAVGLWEETLGAGVPVGGGEDMFLFYKILQAGFIHVYEPKAYVWHQHRHTLKAFRRQIRGYSRGLIAHHLMTWKRFGDRRALFAIATMPIYYYKRAKGHLTGQISYPNVLLLQEVCGHLMAIWGLWKSRQHVHHVGKSQPLLPSPMTRQLLERL